MFNVMITSNYYYKISYRNESSNQSSIELKTQNFLVLTNIFYDQMFSVIAQ